MDSQCFECKYYRYESSCDSPDEEFCVKDMEEFLEENGCECFKKVIRPASREEREEYWADFVDGRE